MPASVRAALAAGCGVVLVVSAGGATLTRLQASVQLEPETSVMAPQAPESVVASVPEAPNEQVAVEPPSELPGSQSPTATASSGPLAPAVPGRRGAIGYLGPVPGILNAEVASGQVYGPHWTRSPLPALGSNIPPMVPEAAGAPVKPGVAPIGSALGSELPDAGKIALSRLANPGATVGSTASKPIAKPTTRSEGVTPERPLSVRMAVGKPKRGYFPGETVAVRLTATADCYLSVIRVDASGKAATVFTSPVLSSQAACAIRLGSNAGAEYLVALGSIKPLGGAEASAALKGSGAGFSLVPSAAGEGSTPTAAWSLAVSQASALGRGAGNLERHEWGVATASFAIRPAPAVTSAKPAVKPSPAPATAPTNGPKPTVGGGGEGSLLPGGAPATKPGEAVKPVEKPTEKPVTTPETKPGTKPVTAPGSGEAGTKGE